MPTLRMHVPTAQPAPTRLSAYRRAEVSSAPRQAEAPRPDDSAAWLAALRGPAPAREEAIAALHALLLRAGRLGLRRHRQLDHVGAHELDDLATQAAGDAWAAVVAKLDTFRGASRSTTWASWFALLEARVRGRRRAWRGGEVPLEADGRPAAADLGPPAHQRDEEAEPLRAVGAAIDSALTAGSSAPSRSTGCRSTCSPSG